MIKATMTLTKDILCRQSAELSLGSLPPETMQASISAQMDQGFFSNNCLDILSNARPSHDDVYATFLEMLAYFGIPTFSTSDAVWVLAEYYLTLIANGEIDPSHGAQQFVEQVIRKFDFPPAKNFCYDSHGFEYVYGVYCSYDDLNSHDESFNILMQDRNDMIIFHAKAWIKKYSPVLRSSEEE
jgi:hypothetical protein